MCQAFGKTEEEGGFMSGVFLSFMLSVSAIALVLVCFAIISIVLSDFIDDFGEDEND